MPFPDETNETRTWLQRFAKPYLTIDCGAYTYGTPHLNVAPADKPRTLMIGRYCSIAREVTIFVGRHGRHPTATFTTYPINMAVSEGVLRSVKAPAYLGADPRDDDKNLDVEIGPDVWIGLGAIIFAGVKIGTGAIIGARTIVTEDVPPYAIVAGSPAQIVRRRHSQEAIDALLCSRWWMLDPDDIWRRLEGLSDPLDMIATAAALGSGR